jgi:hypothetical protein
MCEEPNGTLIIRIVNGEPVINPGCLYSDSGLGPSWVVWEAVDDDYRVSRLDDSKWSHHEGHGTNFTLCKGQSSLPYRVHKQGPAGDTFEYVITKAHKGRRAEAQKPDETPGEMENQPPKIIIDLPPV